MSKDVLTLAREAGFKTLWDQYWDCTTEGIERFAELVRADEREVMLHLAIAHGAPWHFREAIHARSNT